MKKTQKRPCNTTCSSRSVFLASVLLVLSGGGFSRSTSNDSCRSYSEALATTFGVTRSSVSNRNTHIQSNNALSSRGGSSSLFSAKEGTEDEIEIKSSKGVNGRTKPSISIEKFTDKLGTSDQEIKTKHIAETNLPTDIGHFRLRAYRVEEKMRELLKNEHVGTEPCVIYATNKPPFGKKDVPVRIHDQCFTSEVFRSQR